ncbi:MAG: hypothetical protein JNM10_03580, partial [Planctomycetia bacterium]|nr:hypothetical protein [Planctomycetia bacterium]
MTATVDLATQTQRYVKALDRRPLRTLCERAGVPTDRPPAATATALVDAFVNGAKAASLREALSPFGKSLLDRLVLAGDHGVQQAVQTGNEVTPGLGYGAPMHLALEELRLAGLIHGHDFDGRDGVPFLLPPLKRALLWPALDGRLAPLAEPSAPRPPPAFRLAVAAGLFATDEPALVRSGEIHSSAYNKLAKRFADREPWVARLVESVGELRTLGVLTDSTVGPRTTLTLSRDGSSRAFARPPLEVALAGLPRPPTHYHLEVFTHLRTVAKRQPDGAASIRELASLPIVLRTEAMPYDYRPPLDGAGLTDVLRQLVDRGLADRTSPDGAPVRLRPLDDRAVHGTGRFVVLPSLEVLVGWDVAPATVAALAAVADLETVDRVCRYRLTRNSVARGVRLLGDGNAVRRLLEEGSGQPVSQNVEMTIAGWAGAVRILRSYRGEVVVADTPELRALVARDASAAEEVAPGVFLLPA